MRIKASQLDRLMDMLAELVMLRNRRESRVAELQTFNDDLMQCSSKLRIEADNVERTMGARERPPLSELAADLLETTRNQREICERISEENVAVEASLLQNSDDGWSAPPRFWVISFTTSGDATTGPCQARMAQTLLCAKYDSFVLGSWALGSRHRKSGGDLGPGT